MPFPSINYHAPVPNIGMENQLPSGPRGMITLLTNRGLIHAEEFEHINNMRELESDILFRIQNYHRGTDLQGIFHRIHIWGGLSGRNIYVRDGGFVQEMVLPFYQELVTDCLTIRELSDASLQSTRLIVHQFNESVRNIGLSFITKHVHFWLFRNLSTNTLPIYDKVMANNIMQCRSVREMDLVPYWRLMIVKAREEGITLDSLERHLFAYFRPYEE